MNDHRLGVPVFVGILALAAGLSVRGVDSPDEARQHHRQAQELAAAKKFDQAAAAMRRAVRLDPRNDDYLATASDYEFKAGEYDRGLEHALQAVRLNDRAGSHYVLVAANAYGEQDLDLARKYCDTVLKRANDFGPGPCNDARRIQDLVLPKTYTLHWQLDPDRARAVNGRIAVALPKDALPYQRTTYEVRGARSQRLVKGEVNDLLSIVPRGSDTIALTTRVTVQPYSFKKALARARRGPLPGAVRAFLGPCELIDTRSPALKKVARQVRGRDTVETVRNILAWMKKHVEYRLDKKPLDQPDFQSVDEIIDRGHAECRGYAMLFTGLCRAADVPARPIWGLARVTPGQDRRFGDIASHNWAEFYVAGCGWVPVDPQHPETLGFLPVTCIRIFMDGRRSKASQDNLPMFNLVSMNGDRLKFDESR